MRNIIIDTDTATDDAIAIIMALKNKNFNVKAITTVAGNVDVELATNNALYVCELCKKIIPVFKGESRPLKRNLQTSKFFHGKDGLGDTGPYIPSTKAEKQNAIDVIISLAHDFPNQIEIIGIGPLTNIAKAFIKDPSIISKIKTLYVMGGVGEGKGNITEFAEFNYWVDPDAAEIVLNSDLKIKVVAWDTTQSYGFLDKSNFQELNKINTITSNFAINIQRRGLEYYVKHYNEYKIDLADPLAMSVMINDSQVIYKNCNISIIKDGEERGKDIINYNEKGNIKLATQLSRSNFLNILKKSLE